MDHNLHANAPLHHHQLSWGYGAAMPAAPQNHWIPPQQSHLGHHGVVSSAVGVGGVSAGAGAGGHGLKRAMSESDCEELYSEESSKEQISPSGTGSCQLMSRKKRRGVIEKKRRDRINSSLTELKRLVPSAYEKQGSAKLEKAEILQLTVEHLKSLQGKGLDTLSYDPQRFAMEYHVIGFRECAAEVARYLVTIEGMDIQDPMRLRLMSHLQYFAQQREMSAKGCASPHGGWSAAAAASATAAYQPNCAIAPYQTYSSGASSAASAYVTSMPTPLQQPYPAVSASPSAANAQQQQQQQQQQHPQQAQQQQQHASRSASGGSASSETIMNQAQTPLPPSASSTHEPLQATVQQQQQQQQHYTTQEHQEQLQGGGGATYIELTNSQPHSANNNNNHRNASNTPSVSTSGLAYATATAQYAPVVSGGAPDYNTNYAAAAANGSKPYRPWGAEMAY